MSQLGGIALAGLAVAAPALADLAFPARPGYVTAGQKAALAELGADTTTSIITALAQLEGSATTADTAGALCDLLLDAAYAGSTVSVPNAAGGEAYRPSDAFVGYGYAAGATGTGGLDVRRAYFYNMQSGDLTTYTDLGRAIAAVLKRRDGVNSGFLSSAEDLASVTSALEDLAKAMDAQGLLAKPPADVTPLTWAKSGAGWLWDHTLGQLIPSTQTLVLVGLGVVGGVYVLHKTGAAKAVAAL